MQRRSAENGSNTVAKMCTGKERVSGPCSGGGRINSKIGWDEKSPHPDSATSGQQKSERPLPLHCSRSRSISSLNALPPLAAANITQHADKIDHAIGQQLGLRPLARSRPAASMQPPRLLLPPSSPLCCALKTTRKRNYCANEYPDPVRLAWYIALSALLTK